MAPDLPTMIERTARLRAASASAESCEALLEEIEDALCAGYAGALIGDAWCIRTEQALSELVGAARSSANAVEVREVAGEHARVQGGVSALRRELAELRQDRDRVRAALHQPAG